MRYELAVGLRYTRARRRNRFIGINSAVSMIGIAVGVWALIVVLSVMNGFQKEVRGRMLSVAAHVQIVGADGGGLADWRPVAARAAQHPRVLAAAPFVEEQAMLTAGGMVRGALVRGILPAEESRVAEIGEHMRAGSLDDLAPGRYGVVLGADLARALGVFRGDKVALVAPQGLVTPAGVIPRLKQFTVVGIFEAGIDADARLALVHLRDAQVLYQLGGRVSGVRLRIDDVLAAREVAGELSAALPAGTSAFDWTRTHANFFRAVEIEKRVMFVTLALIVFVAAIDIISTLVVAVTDKQADIAILRTLGAAPRSVMQIFVVQGMVIGVVGTAAGVLLGVLTAVNIDVIVPAIENALSVRLFSPDVYLITALPSELQPGDVGAVALMALGLSFLATLYPSWRAGRVNPAEALRYE